MDDVVWFGNPGEKVVGKYVIVESHPDNYFQLKDPVYGKLFPKLVEGRYLKLVEGRYSTKIPAFNPAEHIPIADVSDDDSEPSRFVSSHLSAQAAIKAINHRLDQDLRKSSGPATILDIPPSFFIDAFGAFTERLHGEGNNPFHWNLSVLFFRNSK